MRKALASVPVLAFQDNTKPFHFHMYINETRSIALGVLTQTLEIWKRVVAYPSERLDLVTAIWPACVRALAATALLVKEVDKLALGHKLFLTVPYSTEAFKEEHLRDGCLKPR